MRSKDFAKASGLAVVFDLTAHTFCSRKNIVPLHSDNKENKWKTTI